MIRGLAFALIVYSAPVAADMLRLDVPVDCRLGSTCFIQNYVDHDPGPEAADFACKALTYDGHTGTDIALIDMAAMRNGVDVRAAAAGTVTATRDRMPDILFTAPAAPDISESACGNAVIIAHPDGWQTRYCHLKRGSVRVRSGDIVTSGTVIGQVGLSGKTEFPHLHISVARDDEIVDPFQPGPNAACGDESQELWRDPVDYVPGGLVAIGFSETIPDFDAIKDGSAAADHLGSSAGALVIWGHVFGSQKGDVLQFEIRDERGQFLSRTVLLKRSQARLFRAVGRKRQAAPWPTGTYLGTVTLIRDKTEIDRQQTVLEITR